MCVCVCVCVCVCFSGQICYECVIMKVCEGVNSDYVRKLLSV